MNKGFQSAPIVCLLALQIILGASFQYDQNPVSRFRDPVRQSLAVSSSTSGACSIDGPVLSASCVSELNRERIVALKAVFTNTPYATFPSSSFYAFYHSADALNVTSCTDKNIQWLTSKVTDEWGRYGQPLNDFVQSSIAKGYFNASNVQTLTDIEVGNGGLFATNGQRRFDALIIGFAEYVTSAEYGSIKAFVASGGELVILSPAYFRAEVRYDSATGTEQLVSGHGWSFDGTRACRGTQSRWAADNVNWLGGDYCCFYTDGYDVHGAILEKSNPIGLALSRALRAGVAFEGYASHESTALTNLTDTNAIARWNFTASPGRETVWIYSHTYRGGQVLNTGIFGTDILSSEPPMQLLIYSSLLLLSSPATSTSDTSQKGTSTTSENPQPTFPLLQPIIVIVTIVLGGAALVYSRTIRRHGRQVTVN